MRTALIVDDNSDIRSLLIRALELEGYQVLQAENGLSAQTQLAAGPRPCVLLLDLMIPVMDGNEFLKWKNRQPDYAGIPVIVISATRSEEPPEGARSFLRKPIDLNEMFDLVDAYCG